MNIISLDVGEGRDSYAILQSITRNIPIVCTNREVRKTLVHGGKVMCSKLSSDGNLTMPTPITFDELDKGDFNKSLEYIFLSINEYFDYKGIKVRSMITDIKK